jgi:type I restriction enzyme S subunit
MKETATGSTVRHTSNGSIYNSKIPVPPTIHEQQLIAQALSTTDALITNLQQLIAKKQQIKQGAMQQLLQPKVGWEVKKLGEVCEFYNGKGHEQFITDNGNFIVVNSKFISTNGQVFKHSSVNLFPLEKNDVTMVMSDIPNGKALAKCFIVPENGKYALNQRICAIRSNEVDTFFLSLVLNRNEYYLAFDSGTGQTNLKKNDVLECPLNLPPTKEEQTQIATILSDMDNEINALETKLLKYKNIKQGMMQNLLTGKIRLV